MDSRIRIGRDVIREHDKSGKDIKNGKFLGEDKIWVKADVGGQGSGWGWETAFPVGVR